MAKLFDRDIAVTVGTTKITGLSMEFKVVKTSKPEPNTVELVIYNLNAETRAKLQTLDIPVQIEAGYKDNIEILFKGQLRRAFSSHNGVDWVTKLSSGDGSVAYRTARINQTLAPGATLKEAFKAGAKKLGAALGDSLKKIDTSKGRDGLRDFAKGDVLFGQVTDELDRLARASGVEWSIQDGVLQITDAGKPTDEGAIVLSAATGLVGSPEAGDKGTIKAVSLLQPGLRPGRKVKLESQAITGFYRVETVEHVGDKAGQNWYSNVECRAL